MRARVAIVGTRKVLPLCYVCTNRGISPYGIWALTCSETHTTTLVKYCRLGCPRPARDRPSKEHSKGFGSGNYVGLGRTSSVWLEFQEEMYGRYVRPSCPTLG